VRFAIIVLIGLLSVATAPVSAQVAAPPAPAAAEITVGPLKKLKFSGLVQVWYRAGDAENADSFRVRRSELYVSGDLNARVKFQVMIDPSKSLSLNTTSAVVAGSSVLTGSSVNQSGRILQDAFISVAVAPHVEVQVGQFKVPLNLEGLASSYALQLVERSMMTTEKARGGAFGDIRDVGIMARGTFANGLEYRVGVFNGFGSHQNGLDTDSHKAVAGRLAYQTPVAGLKVGGFGAVDRDTATDLERTRTGVDVAYARGRGFVQAELVSGRDGSLMRRGYYVSAGYRILPKADVAVRYDVWDPDTHADETALNAAEKDYNVAFNYYLTGNHFKWQAEYLHKSFSLGTMPSRNVLLSNVQVMW
jgi:phosphate-selective porin